MTAGTPPEQQRDGRSQEEKGDRPAPQVQRPGGSLVPGGSAQGTPEGEQTEGAGQEDTAAGGQEQRQAVLVEERPVPLHAVEAVQAPLELPHGGGGGQQPADRPEDQGEVVVSAAVALGVRGRLGQQRGDRPGGGTFHGVDDDVADGRTTERTGHPDEGDDPLDGGQGHEEGQRPGVAESVGPPQPLEGVGQEPAPSGAPQRAPGVVSTELPCLGDQPGRAHLSSLGTRTVTAAGFTSNCSRSVGGRVPPSSS